MIDQTPVELAAHTGIDERYGLDLWPEPHLAELAGRWVHQRAADPGQPARPHRLRAAAMMARALASASELIGALRRRELGSGELLETYLERVDRLDPALGAVVTLDVERERAEAAAADEDVPAGGRHVAVVLRRAGSDGRRWQGPAGSGDPARRARQGGNGDGTAWCDRTGRGRRRRA